MTGVNDYLNSKTKKLMKKVWKPEVLLTKRDLAVDFLLCSMADFQWQLEKIPVNTGVHI